MLAHRYIEVGTMAGSSSPRLSTTSARHQLIMSFVFESPRVGSEPCAARRMSTLWPLALWFAPRKVTSACLMSTTPTMWPPHN
jgi:hypothetical protein